MSPEIIQYDRIADLKRLHFIINSLKNAIPPDAQILDVGCGNGIISMHLGLQGYNVLGIDISEKTIAQANARNTQPNVRFMAISAEDLSARGMQYMQYDAVICSEVLEHLHDPSILLHTIYMTLKDEGTLIVTVPNGRGPRELFVTRPTLKAQESPGLWKIIMKIKKVLGFTGTTIQSHADNLDHVQFFTLKALYALAAKNHFTITRMAKTNFVEDVFPFSLFTKRIKALQKFDCMVAEWLPAGFTGGFNTIWKKNEMR